MTDAQMNKDSTSHGNKQTPTEAAVLLRSARAEKRRNGSHIGIAAELLRVDRGAMKRIARRIGVHPSLVSRVARGKKTSERVRLAIVRYLLARQRELATAAFLIEHGRR